MTIKTLILTCPTSRCSSPRVQMFRRAILSSSSFASTFSHFQTLPQHMLSHNCSVLLWSFDENQLCFRSLTKCSHCIKTHDTVTLLTASKSIREVLSTSDAAANTDGSLNVANSLAQYLDFSLCASSTLLS